MHEEAAKSQVLGFQNLLHDNLFGCRVDHPTNQDLHGDLQNSFRLTEAKLPLLYLSAAFVYPRLSFRARENLETLARVVLFKKATSPIAAPGHPLSAVPINPGEAFELLVFGGYIKVSLASSRRDDPDAIAVVFFYVLVSFRAADFRISHRQRLSMRFRDG